MLLKTSIDRKQKEIEIEQKCGQSFNLLTKFKNQLFGSPKYKILSIYPDIISFEKNNDLINCNLELRKKVLFCTLDSNKTNMPFMVDSIKLCFNRLTTFLKFK